MILSVSSIRESLRLSRRESKKIEVERLRLLSIERKKRIYSQQRAQNSARLAIKSSTWADPYKVLRKPSGSEIPHGLPTWNVGYIDDKLVFIEPEEEDFALSRGKAGKSLFKRIDGREFKLDNEIELPYHPLHDPHMRYFLKHNLRSLKTKGLVTGENGVICSLKEFNYYRKYLHTLHAESINKLSKERDQEETEATTIRRIMLMNKVFEERQERKTIRAERTKALLAKQKAERKLKQEKCQARSDHVDFIMEQKRNARHLASLEAEKKHNDFKMWLQSRVDVAEVIERKRLLNVILQRRAAKKEQKEREEMKAEERRTNRKKKIEKRWNLKVNSQMLRLEKERDIIDMRNQELQLKAQNRLQFVQNLSKKREKLLDKLKKEKKDEVEEAVKLRKLEIKKFYAGETQDVVAASNANMPHITFGIKGITERLEKRIASTCTQEITELLFMGVQKSKKEKFKLPVEVNVAVTHLLNSVIEIFIRKRVSEEAPVLISHIIAIYNTKVKDLVHSQRMYRGDLTDEELTAIQESFYAEEESLSSSSSSDVIDEIMRVRSLSAKEKISDTLHYLYEGVLKLAKKNIRIFFEDLGTGLSGISEIPDLSNNDMRIMNVIEYTTVTLLNFAETRTDIDADVSVIEITDFIERQILHTVEN